MRSYTNALKAISPRLKTKQIDIENIYFSLSMNVLETSVVDENFTDIWTEMRNLVLREVRWDILLLFFFKFITLKKIMNNGKIKTEGGYCM